jgi:predicted anti-sigma-YlaC factor YlaD
LAAVCGILAVALMAAVLTPSIDDGVVGKAGLIAASLGFGAMALQMFEGVSLTRPLLLAAAGLLMGLFAPALRPVWRRLSGARDGVSERHL